MNGVGRFYIYRPMPSIHFVADVSPLQYLQDSQRQWHGLLTSVHKDLHVVWFFQVPKSTWGKLSRCFRSLKAASPFEPESRPGQQMQCPGLAEQESQHRMACSRLY